MSNLLPILALARAGATNRAWDALIAERLDRVATDTETLTLKGRLLKDQARKAQGEARAQLYQQSAQAYTDAAALHPASYPLINAATMLLFAGQSEPMALLAQHVLTLLDTREGVGETPYWHEATKAEALLLLGLQSDAETALREARAHAPQAWEDHATTLRQFRSILGHRGEPHDWLAAYAPPKSIYFKGIMGISADDSSAAYAIAALVAGSGARFAYGALAAGADILIAEAVVRDGGELHVILPVSPDIFKAQSVEPFGEDWLPRFDALVQQAASVEIVTDDDRLSTAAIRLASAVAKGRAIDNAERLESEALPVEVTDRDMKHVQGGASGALQLNRSARPQAAADLDERQLSVLVATDSQYLPQIEHFVRQGGFAIAAMQGPEGASELIRQIGNATPDSAIAVHALVTGEEAVGAATRSQLERLVQAAAPGTVIATSTAAMLLKASGVHIWIEPLGELPDPSAALSIYALGIAD